VPVNKDARRLSLARRSDISPFHRWLSATDAAGWFLAATAIGARSTLATATAFYFGRRISGSTGNRYGVRTLCAICAANLDRKKRNVALFFSSLVGGFFLLSFIASLIGPPQDSSTSTTTSASIAEIPSGSGARAVPEKAKGHTSKHHKKAPPKEESEP